jgi:hypothetical protein
MDTPIVFEFTARHTPESFRCATLAMWKIFWRRNLVWFWPAAAVCFGGVGLGAYVLGEGSLLWFPFALFVLEAVLIAYSFWKASQRARKPPPGPVQFRLTPSNVQYSDDRSSHTVPWDTFKFTRRDEYNLYLFVTQFTALAVPTDGLPPGAADFMVAQVGKHIPP